MPNALSSPTMLGLYINSFKKGSGIDPYTELLGTDGFGNYSGGNKLTDLFNYTNQYAYNYGLFYGLTDSSFTSSVTSEQFLAAPGFGQDILYNVFPIAHAAGMINRAAICDLAQPQMTPITVGPSHYTGSDGISQVVKIVNWNASVSYDATRIFNWINFETEFWNFPYQDALPKTGTIVGLNVNSTTTEARFSPVGSGSFAGIGVNDFIFLNGQWRQVIQVVNNGLIRLDRPWTTPGVSGAWSYLSFATANSTVDYETFLYRVTKACQYIADFGSGELIDIYVGFPSYDFKSTYPAGYPRQLAKLYQAGVTKILLTDYYRLPQWNYINGDYASGATYTGCVTTVASNIVTGINTNLIFPGLHVSGPGIASNTTIVSVGTNSFTMSTSAAFTNTNNSLRLYTFPGSYHRVTDDIVSDATLRELGQIMSMETATKNNSSTPTANINNNFCGYFMDGRSILPHSGSTNFWPVNAGNTAITNSAPMFEPDITWNPLSMDEAWQYVAETAPTGAGYVTKGSNTFNDYITAGGTTGTNLDSYIDFNTLIVFDQEFMRQLNITPAVALNTSITGSNVSCNGYTDGTAAVSVSGGVGPYTYLWDDPLVSTTSSITGLAAGTYTCLVTDSAATTSSPSITITEPAVLGIADWENSDTACSGGLGSIRLNDVVGGYGNYLACVVPAGDLPTGWVSFTGTSPGLVFPNLTAGLYDLYLADGNPLNNCFSVVSGITIGQGGLATISCTNTNVTCPGGSNGTITTSPASSFTSYTLFDNLALPVQSNNTGVFNNLSAGYYSVWGVTGVCTTNLVGVTITEPTTISLSGTTTSPTCYNGTGGAINIGASGGTGAFSYILQYPSGLQVSNMTGNFLSLSPGTYTVYAEDSLGCQGGLTAFVVTNPSQITATYAVTQPIQGSSTTGSITLQSITGGAGGYTYLWSTGDTVASLTDLVPGTYTVTITDDNSCSVTQSFTIRLECDTFTLEEMKIAAYKAQCCTGELALKYIRLVKEGRQDLANALMPNIKALTMIIETLYCTSTPGEEPRISCADMQNLLDQINNLCDCDCCKDPNTETINVTYDPITGTIKQV